jgi:1-phosphofructokinase
VARVRECGVPVWLDTSGEALVAGVRARPTGIKPNENELSDCVGQRLENAEALLQAARRLQGGGVEEVLLSTGAGSVTWLGQREALRATPPRVQVVSTVGAGDTLLAGTVHGLLSGWPRERCLRFATALASESVRHIGVGEVEAPDFEGLQAQTDVEAMSLESLFGRGEQ